MLKESLKKLEGAIAALPELAEFVAALNSATEEETEALYTHQRGIGMFLSGHCTTSPEHLAFWAAAGVVGGHYDAVHLHENITVLG